MAMRRSAWKAQRWMAQCGLCATVRTIRRGPTATSACPSTTTLLGDARRHRTLTSVGVSDETRHQCIFEPGWLDRCWPGVCVCVCVCVCMCMCMCMRTGEEQGLIPGMGRLGTSTQRLSSGAKPSECEAEHSLYLVSVFRTHGALPHLPHVFMACCFSTGATSASQHVAHGRQGHVSELLSNSERQEYGKTRNGMAPSVVTFPNVGTGL